MIVGIPMVIVPQSVRMVGAALARVELADTSKKVIMAKSA